MPRGRLYTLLCAFLVIGGCIGVFYPTFFAGVKQDDQPGEKAEAASQVTAPSVSDSARGSDGGEKPSSRPEINRPEGAIPGEVVLRFDDREAYLAYLQALQEAGHRPLGRITALLRLRVDEEAVAALDPQAYGAVPDFSFVVEQPRPPKQISPEVLASLEAFGTTARSIVGGPVEGDGSGVLVAILDSGMEAHPRFDGVKVAPIDLVGDGVAGPGASHGTSVGSIVSGSDGIAPKAALLPVRVLDGEGLGNSFHVAEGIVEAVDRGARVINMSLGVYEHSQVLRDAVRYAARKGVVMVAAAGNDAFARLPYPAAYPEVLSVTAIDATGRQAMFPNQSKSIDFAAPGVGIEAAGGEGGTTFFTGTSAAAPFVTGTAVALLSADPGLSADGVTHLLKEHRNEAGAPGSDPAFGGGILDWDRLRERENPEVVDVALAAIHLSEAAKPGTTMPVTLIVENRGTRWLTGAELEVLVGDGEPVAFPIETIGPGENTTRKVYTQVPSRQDQKHLEIAARVRARKPVEDVRPGNDVKAVRYRPVRAD